MTVYAVTNPATGEVVQEYPLISDDDLATVTARAHSTYRAWSRTTTVSERAALERRVGDLHRERREELAAIITREMGKLIREALGEVDFCATIYDYYADNAELLMADEPIAMATTDGRAVVRRAALGPILGVMPWNFPYYQVARLAAPNLVVGNTILLKHAPQCPASAAALQQMFDDAGFPAGAYTNIYATNEQVATLVADDRVQGVSVTGSERAGAALAELAGRNLKKVVLELGGSDPFVLLSTDDLGAVVNSALAARMLNAGQACNAAKRFIVSSDLYDGFVQRLTSAMTAISPGDPTDPDTALGPLSSTLAADRLEDQLRRAVDGGATLEGGDRTGNYFRPGVLTGVKPGNDVHHEELFGPIAIVYSVDSEEEAIDLANDTPFGLGSYVFTTDNEQAARITDRIEAGMVFVNVVGATGADLPFGGIKRSGFGRELGRSGIEEFVNKKLIRAGAV